MEREAEGREADTVDELWHTVHRTEHFTRRLALTPLCAERSVTSLTSLVLTMQAHSRYKLLE